MSDLLDRHCYLRATRWLPMTTWGCPHKNKTSFPSARLLIYCFTSHVWHLIKMLPTTTIKQSRTNPPLTSCDAQKQMLHDFAGRLLGSRGGWQESNGKVTCQNKSSRLPNCKNTSLCSWGGDNTWVQWRHSLVVHDTDLLGELSRSWLDVWLLNCELKTS